MSSFSSNRILKTKSCNCVNCDPECFQDVLLFLLLFSNFLRNTLPFLEALVDQGKVVLQVQGTIFVCREKGGFAVENKQKRGRFAPLGGPTGSLCKLTWPCLFINLFLWQKCSWNLLWYLQWLNESVIGITNHNQWWITILSSLAGKYWF